MCYTAKFYHLTWIYKTCNLILAELFAATSRSTVIMTGESQVWTDYQLAQNSKSCVVFLKNKFLTLDHCKPLKLKVTSLKSDQLSFKGFLFVCRQAQWWQWLLGTSSSPIIPLPRAFSFTTGDAHAKHLWKIQSALCSSWITPWSKYSPQIRRIATWSYSSFSWRFRKEIET